MADKALRGRGLGSKSLADSSGAVSYTHLDVYKRQELDAVIQRAWSDAERDGVHGQQLTPYLLDYIRRATDGRSLDANVALYRNNVALAAQVATALVVGA